VADHAARDAMPRTQAPGEAGVPKPPASTTAATARKEPSRTRPAPLVLTGHLVQGGFITGTTAAGASVTLDGRVLRVSEDGTFIAGFPRSAKALARLEVRLPDGRAAVRTLRVRPRKFRVQRINNLPQAMVTPPEDALPRIQAEQKRLAGLWGVDTPEPMFKSGFVLPTSGPISGVYGSQRILNGVPRQVHWGVDIAAPDGAPIAAPADGIVLLAEPDFYYTGGTILLDHGFGLVSGFLHLSAIEVAEGQRVKQGDAIGRVGATGRATGPHLDWRVRWFDVFVDPQLLPKPQAAPSRPLQE
jgi:murein DD-endopeptidase MepM/ murein hydrolase activator NlpD